MKTALWSALLLGLLAISHGQAVKPAIVNGQDAPRGRYRYMAQLRDAGNPTSPFCGGTLIHPRIVLTAAHCVRDVDTGVDAPPGQFRPVVHIGGYLRTTEPTGPGQQFQSFRVSQTVVHPRFTTGINVPDKFNYDVAVMLLPARSTLPVVKLVGPSTKPALPVAAGTSVTVIGWGTTTGTNPPQFVEPLQELDKTLLSIQQCQTRLGATYNVNFNTNAMICAANDGPPPGDSCRGDSGGPLIVPGAVASRDAQIGIVSWGPPACTSPGGYTDVGMVFDWVADQVFRLTGDRLKPKPFDPVTGFVLADNEGIGFNGQPVTYAGAKGAPLDIFSVAGALSLPPSAPKGYYLNGILTDGSTPGSRALGYVAWSWGATVAAQVGPNGRMAVTLNRAPIRQGTHKRLGALVDIKFAQDKCGRWSCAPRRLDIAVRTSPSRPFIKITIIQPWVAASGAVLRTGKAKGSYAPYLEVKVVLSQKPAQQPTGVLGQTIAV